MKILSCFAGIGGFDLGFERAGMETEAHVEIDKYASQVFARHFPDSKHYEDIRAFTDVPSVDLVCGGFPCQDLSVAGKRAGLAGNRSGLFWELVRVIHAAQPRVFVFENVPGLLSSNGGRDMGTVVKTLAELGYGVSWRVLDSQYFGVAQRRRRVFIVGSLGGGRSAEILFEPESVSGDSKPSREAGERVTPSVTGGAPFSRTGNERVEAEAVVAGTLSAHARGKTQNANETDFLVAKPIGCGQGRTKGADHQTYVAFGWNKSSSQTMTVGDTTDALQASPTSNPAVASILRGFGHGWQGQHNSTHAINDGMSVRRLTPRECERLQGFPDDWTEGHSDTQRYKMLGNAVTVNVAEWIGRRIMGVA